MIKNIIFDFGNVLFDIDLPKIEDKLKYHYQGAYEEARNRLAKDRIFELYEIGGLTTEAFIDAIRMAGPGVELSAAAATDLWNEILIGMPRVRFDFLWDLRQHYKVFLLSNINDLHERWIADYMVREHGIDDYESRYFDGVYFSHLIRLRKPNREIYEFVLADAEIQAEESIFFDDLQVNVAAANEVGIRGVWHEPGTEIMDRVRSILEM